MSSYTIFHWCLGPVSASTSLDAVPVETTVSHHHGRNVHRSRERETDVAIASQIASTHGKAVVHHTVSKPTGGEKHHLAC